MTFWAQCPSLVMTMRPCDAPSRRPTVKKRGGNTFCRHAYEPASVQSSGTVRILCGDVHYGLIGRAMIYLYHNTTMRACILACQMASYAMRSMPVLFDCVATVHASACPCSLPLPQGLNAPCLGCGSASSPARVAAGPPPACPAQSQRCCRCSPDMSQDKHA